MAAFGIGHRKLLEHIERMYLASSVEDLHRILLEAMPELVQSDTFELVVCGTPNGTDDLYLTKEDTFTEDEKAFALIHVAEHPIVKAVEAGASGVLSVSRCSSDREWHSSALFYDAGYRRQGLRRELAVPLAGVSQRGLATFSMARAKPDFSDSELELLQWVSPHVARAWRQAQRRNAGLSPVLVRQTFPILSPREAEILFWIIEGKQNAEVAEILSLRLGTVQESVQNMLRKLDMENRHQMTVAVLRACLV